MSQSPKDVFVKFRVPAELAERAKAYAKREETTLSQILRNCLESALARADALQPNGALGQFLSGKLESAARGSVESLRWLFDNRVNGLLAADTRSISAIMLASEAMAFGRLLASRGDETDMRRLAGAIVQSSIVFRDLDFPQVREALLAEAVSILEQLAENGDELASLASQAVISRETERLVEIARQYRKNATTSVPEDA